LQLSVESVVFNGLASALAVLNKQQKEMGALVIDLGAGATEFVVYSDSVLRHSGVIAVGGDHVSNDIAIGLKIPLGRAEQLKIESGSAEDSGEEEGYVAVPAEVGHSERTIHLGHLRRIQAARLEETFELVVRDVGPMLNLCRAGVFLTGGGARTRQVESLAQRVFKLPVTVARAQDVSGSMEAIDHPEFATPIGIARFGAMQLRKTSPRPGWRSALGTLFRR
jgi:cell division protein FtsA